MDVFVFEQEHTFIESFFSPEPVELWMRSFVIVLMIVFSLITQKLLSSQEKANNQLKLYKETLEIRVSQRTEELENTNKLLKAEISERKNIEQKLEELATTDALTSLYNRRKFEELLTREIDRNRRYKTELSLIFCDIDNFKRINDEFGHDIGDTILRDFAASLKISVRSTDIVARWGGEEFVILVSNATPQQAQEIAEKLRKTIEDKSFPPVGRVTASFGLTKFKSDDNQVTIIKRADQALYQAKENGRNIVQSKLD